jgi:hypothetical protein
MILLAIGILAVTAPSFGDDVDVGALVAADGKNDKDELWSHNCAGKVKVQDDMTIKVEDFVFDYAPRAQFVAFDKDEPTFPTGGKKPTFTDYPLKAVFIREGKEAECQAVVEKDKKPATPLTLKAGHGKLEKQTKFIGLVCLYAKVIFCRVAIPTDALAAMPEGTENLYTQCDEKIKSCWNGTQADCQIKETDAGNGNPESANATGTGSTLPLTFQSIWCPSFGSLLIAIVAVAGLVNGSTQ